MSAPRAAFFDLDRTLVRVNTGHLYFRWRAGLFELGPIDLVRLSWWSVRYAAGALDAEALGQRAAASIRGREEARFREDCRAWAEAKVLPHLTAAARAEVAARRRDGYVCAVLTTSTPYVAEPVARALEIDHVLSSRLTVAAGRFTGTVDGPMCYGAAKVVRARQWAEANGLDLEASAFYTDSVTDLPMLEAVAEPRVVNPDVRLARVARQRGWPIHSWT